MYCEAMLEIKDSEGYIDEIHEILWSNSLSGSRMSELMLGERTGTYAEYCALRPEEYCY